MVFLFSLLCLTAALFPIVQGTSNSTFFQNVIVNQKFGRLTILSSSMVLASLSVFANGTLLWDLRGWDRTQVTYLFTAQSYGNGTFNIVFLTDTIPSEITAPGSSSISITQSPTQTVQYTSSQTSTLELDFTMLPSVVIANGIVIASAWFVIIFVSLGVLFTLVMFNQVIAQLKNRKPFMSPLQATIVGLMVIVGFSLLILIGVMTSGTLKGLGF